MNKSLFKKRNKFNGIMNIFKIFQKKEENVCKY